MRYSLLTIWPLQIASPNVSYLVSHRVSTALQPEALTQDGSASVGVEAKTSTNRPSLVPKMPHVWLRW